MAIIKFFIFYPFKNYTRNYCGCQVFIRKIYDNNSMSKFKERLKELRIEKGFTQKQISQVLNISEDSIYNWEKGRSEPSITDLINLAILLDVTIDYLVGKIEI